MNPSPSNHKKLTFRLYVGLGINALIIGFEFIGGYFINSIGLMTDAGHNLIDQGALFLALYAHILAARPATETRTFGYHRAGIIAAFANGFILLLTAGVLAYVAFTRLLTPVPIPGGWIIVIALVSFSANLAVALLLKHGAQDDLTGSMPSMGMPNTSLAVMAWISAPSRKASFSVSMSATWANRRSSI